MRLKSFSFTQQNPLRISLLPLHCHKLRPFLPSYFHPSIICWPPQIVKHLITQSFLVFCYALPLKSKYVPRHPVLKHPVYIHAQIHAFNAMRYFL